MNDPIKWKSKIVLVKPQAIYGTDPVPTGENAMLLTDVQLQPMEGQDVSRNLELAYLGAQDEIPTGFYAVLTGTFELVGSGTAGTAPGWGPLLRACGVAEVITVGTSVVYTPVTDGQESVGIYFKLGPWRHLILGARGTAVITLNAQGIPVVRVTLTGLFSRPSDHPVAAPTLTGFQMPQVASKKNTPTFTIGGVPFVASSFEMNLGCDVQTRLLMNVERIVIVDRAETITATVEAVPYTIYNPFAIAEDRTRQAIVVEHGTLAGKRVAIRAPTAAQRRPSGFSQSQNIVEWPLTFVPLQTAGDDQWSITLT